MQHTQQAHAHSSNTTHVALAPRARQAYLQAALDALLAQPLVAFRRERSVCVVAFGRLAYVNSNGSLSVAWHDGGVLTDVDTALDEAVEELPVRPTVAGVQKLAALALVRHTARWLSDWAGEPVDLRSLDQSPWSEHANSSALQDTLWDDAQRAVQAIPASRWRAIAMAVPRTLGVDLRLVKASRAAMLGDLSPLEAYHHAQALGLQSLASDDPTPAVLRAHILSATYASSTPGTDLTRHARWFRRELQQAGVTPLGWRLLLESPIGYWRHAFRSGGYDLQLAALCLLVGQSLSPPRLPPLAFVAEANDTAWLHDLGDSLRAVPPQVWRTLVALHEQAPSRCTGVLGEILPWAAATGSRMPASLRQAGFRTLEQHAIAYLFERAPSHPVAPEARPPARYEDAEGYAQELTTEEAVSAVGRMMGNCLPQLWPEVETGRMRVFFAVWRGQRLVIGLRAKPGGRAAWELYQAEGRRNRRLPKDGTVFVERLCESLNQ